MCTDNENTSGIQEWSGRKKSISPAWIHPGRKRQDTRYLIVIFHKQFIWLILFKIYPRFSNCSIFDKKILPSDPFQLQWKYLAPWNKSKRNLIDSFLQGTWDFFGLNHYTTQYVLDFPTNITRIPTYYLDQDMITNRDPDWPTWVNRIIMNQFYVV